MPLGPSPSAPSLPSWYAIRSWNSRISSSKDGYLKKKKCMYCWLGVRTRFSLPYLLVCLGSAATSVVWWCKIFSPEQINFSPVECTSWQGICCYRQTTLWVWGRMTSVIWYDNWTLALFVICNGRSRQDASNPEKCFINAANHNISSPNSASWQSDKWTYYVVSSDFAGFWDG